MPFSLAVKCINMITRKIYIHADERNRSQRVMLPDKLTDKEVSLKKYYLLTCYIE